MSAAPQPPAVHPQVAAFLAAFIALREAVRETADPHAAYQLGRLVEAELRRMNEEWPAVRGETVVRIRDAEALSLRPLARRLGVSPTLAHNLIKRAEQPTEGTER